MNASDFSLIDIPFEDHVIHVCHRGDGSTVVEVICLNDGISHLDRNIQNHTGDGTAYLGRTADIGVLGDTVADDLQCTLCVVTLFDRFQILCFGFLKLLFGNHALLEQLFVAFIDLLNLLQGDFGYVDT